MYLRLRRGWKKNESGMYSYAKSDALPYKLYFTAPFYYSWYSKIKGQCFLLKLAGWSKHWLNSVITITWHNLCQGYEIADTHKVEPISRLTQKYGRKLGLLIEVGCKVSPQRIQSGDYLYEERGSLRLVQDNSIMTICSLSERLLGFQERSSEGGVSEQCRLQCRLSEIAAGRAGRHKKQENDIVCRLSVQTRRWNQWRYLRSQEKQGCTENTDRGTVKQRQLS